MIPECPSCGRTCAFRKDDRQYCPACLAAKVRAGMAAARASGVHLGCPRKASTEQRIARLRRAGCSLHEIARILGRSVTFVAIRVRNAA